MVERTMLATSSVHASFSNTYVFDVYKLIAGVGGRFNGADTRAAENDFLGLSRRKAGRCVWHGSSTGLLLKSPVNSSSAIYRIQARWISRRKIVSSTTILLAGVSLKTWQRNLEIIDTPAAFEKRNVATFSRCTRTIDRSRSIETLSLSMAIAVSKYWELLYPPAIVDSTSRWKRQVQNKSKRTDVAW